jgi:phage-related protein
VPLTEVQFYRENDGEVPVLEWLEQLRRDDRRAFVKCLARIRRLADQGHKLRRPEADYLRDGIYELRVRRGRVHYRLLYFFHGRNVALLANALAKEGEVPAAEIERAIRRLKVYKQDPDKHAHELESPDA